MNITKTKKKDLLKIAGKRGLWIHRKIYKSDGGFCHLTSLMDSTKSIYVPLTTKVTIAN